MTLPTRRLGPIEVGAVGLGCMSFGGSYGDASAFDATAVIRRARPLAAPPTGFPGAQVSRSLVGP